MLSYFHIEVCTIYYTNSCSWYGVFKKVCHVGVNMHYLVWRSHKSASEVTIAFSLVWHFQKGMSCRGKYALFVLVWFGGPINQLQRSPLHCPWCGIFKKVYHVGVNMYYLVWFGLEVPQISWRCQKGISCWGKYALFGLVWFGGPTNQLQRSPLHCP